MRVLLPLALIGVGLAAWANVPTNDLEPADIALRAGENVVVKGTVSEVFTDPRSQTTFIDMGGAYPFNHFAAVIFPDSARAFPMAASLNGKHVEIAGTVRLYRGKPEIILTAPNQIQMR
jgi:DNA/RNA endonuclease YhcR with UshA esterase domain